MRLSTTAYLERTRIPVTIDLGFGDALADPAKAIPFSTMLDFPDPEIRTYPPTSVIAEKFQAMVALGIANGRMKDFYDLWAIPQVCKIDPPGARRRNRGDLRTARHPDSRRPTSRHVGRDDRRRRQAAAMGRLCGQHRACGRTICYRGRCGLGSRRAELRPVAGPPMTDASPRARSDGNISGQSGPN